MKNYMFVKVNDKYFYKVKKTYLDDYTKLEELRSEEDIQTEVIGKFLKEILSDNNINAKDLVVRLNQKTATVSFTFNKSKDLHFLGQFQ